ncbi:MAG: 4Fe-4S binding protein [Negativicutes bacterium]|nr:4Fe-4S binding protein [Negativicutes bacterium]
MQTTRRIFIKMAGGAILSAALFCAGGLTGAKAGLIRPPGAVEEETFQSVCLRCHQCLDICPEKAIASAHLTQGWRVAATPVLSGGCTLCMKCVQQCPSGALAKIDAKEARMGTAAIIEKECVGCDKCIKPCPTGAISKVPGKRLVAVDVNKCTGCMTCIKHCPVDPIAIVVTAAGAKRPKFTKV